MMTKTETLVNLLKELGLKEITTFPPSKKYRKFSSMQEGQFYFVGTHGGLRKGEKSSDSISLDADAYIEKIKRILQKRKEGFE
jgi:hypothetical protein